MKPITPKDANTKRLELIPDVVFEAVNELIVEQIGSSQSVTLTQTEVVNRILSKSDISRNVIFDKHYLDFEEVYTDAGWKVTFDKAAYYETCDSTWRFVKAS